MLDVSYYRKTDEIISRYVRDARSLIPICRIFRRSTAIFLRSC